MFVFKVRFFLLLTSSIASDVTLLHMLQQYCSISLNCELENLGNENTTETKWDACCGQCSCDEQCGQTQSCCFAEDNVKYSRIHGKECIYPHTGDISDFQQIGGHGFVMITQCPDMNKECKYKNGIVNVNPVESSSSEVFINKECARCNNVSNFVRWNARIVSRGVLLYSFRNIEEPNINPETIIYEPPTTFYYPKCYNFFVTVNISKCPNDLFKQACISIYLPLMTRVGTFQNVFCYLCIYSLYSHSHLCSPSGDKFYQGTLSLVLDNTLDTTTIADYFSRQHMLGNKENCQEDYMPHPSKVRAVDLNSK